VTEGESAFYDLAQKQAVRQLPKGAHREFVLHLIGDQGDGETSAIDGLQSVTVVPVGERPAPAAVAARIEAGRGRGGGGTIWVFSMRAFWAGGMSRGRFAGSAKKSKTRSMG
jgi:hypothetical protein